MAKQAHKVYIASEIWQKLRARAEEHGFIGPGNVAALMEKISLTDLVFLDKNATTLLKAYVEALKK